MNRLNQTDPAYIEAMAHYMEGRWSEAQTALGALVATYPDSEYILITLGNISYSLGKLDEAVEWYSKGVKVKDDSSVGWYKLGVCLFRMGKLNDAQVAFKKVLERPNQSHAMASYFLGLSTYLSGQDSQSEEAFALFRSISKESLIANFFLGQLKIKEQKYKEALELLNELVAQSPEIAEAWFMIGQCHYGLHQNPQAIGAYKKALVLSPDDQRIKNKLTLLTEVDW